MAKLSYTGIKHNEENVEVKLLVDVQNDLLEVTHTKEFSQVMNKTTGKYIIVKRNTLKVEIVE